MYPKRKRAVINAGPCKRQCHLNYVKERMWDPFYLKKKIKEVGLSKDLKLYQIRLWRSYLSIFFVLHILVTIGHCLLILVFAEIKDLIYFDVVVYFGCGVFLLAVLSVNFCEQFVERHNWVMLLSSSLAAIILLSADKLTAAIHYDPSTEMVVASFYDVYIVFVIYMYLPVPSVWSSIALGTVAAVVYIIYYVMCMSPEQLPDGSVVADASHYLCLNLVGIFYRITTNMIVRSSFLDRYQYVKEELRLRNARWHEKSLVDSILPPQISISLQSEIQKRITMVNQGTRPSIITLRRSMAVQVHPDVSILYADVVNYTHLTTTVDVVTLINLLHDLYGRFDKAAVTFRVQRIKFLGDCYYCVAGMAEADPDHAKNCVDLGFAMISHIQEVREIYGVDINMRIGVNSGSIFAGVLGEAKLQLDIWGTDVTIANVLESTGLPGCVHVSSRTLSYIDEDEFAIEPAPSWAAEHPLFIKHDVQSYILRSNNMSLHDTQPEPSASIYSFSRLGSQSSDKDEALQTLFKQELYKEFQKMPVFRWRFDQNELDSSSPNISFLCLKYRDKDMENLFITQRDYIFKYSIMLAFLISCFCSILQLVADTKNHVYVSVLSTTVMLIFVGLTFIVWYKKICWFKNHVKSKANPIYNRFSCFMFYLLKKIQISIEIRILIYLFIEISQGTIIALIMILCDANSYILGEIEKKIFHYEAPQNECFHPWVITNMMSIIICMAFTFTNIPLPIKTVVAIIMSVGYILLINLHLAFFFHHSYSSSPSLPAEYAHTLQILVTMITVYQKERMNTFASKVNFKWRQDLIKKQKDAALTNQSITILLHNILPEHVVKVYLNSLAKHELYYENYQMVSVMFAMLMNFQMDLKNLRILNDIITEFDMLLLYYKEYYVVEKIKVVGCTYMAACGLDLNFAGSVSFKTRVSNLKMSASRGQYLSLPLDSEDDDMDEVVFVLASFALDMMRTLSKCKNSHINIHDKISVCNGSITIGLSSGEVMAGIVGASQPHYDIWGDAVNMASRMQSTGLPDNIQVTEESATILKDFGIKCNYRGLTYVKGRGEIPTYLVGIDKTMSFIDTIARRSPSHVLRSTRISLSSEYRNEESNQSHFDGHFV
ncbi:uncharacterized protein Dana_GF23420 [Drosophila ananassae]|uniref:adenylate cyclase n=2 Tax=Drosophila ananassae TaxID=7217 RepID=B3MVG8_DROAN|nr:adenylyl cyclase X E isoform X1 [Drosophila ananassae]EDV33233.2 uncharacterized protein Dana_GF23420 [Drosophila ananassae]